MKHLFFILLAFLLTACGGSGSPVVEVVGNYDFGVVTKGETVTAVLPLRNAGQATLVVENISTSCGCTTATLSTMSLAPQEEATLVVSYDSGAHEADIGLLDRHVFVATNDPEQAVVMIRFTALVEE